MRHAASLQCRDETFKVASKLMEIVQVQTFDVAPDTGMLQYHIGPGCECGGCV